MNKRRSRVTRKPTDAKPPPATYTLLKDDPSWTADAVNLDGLPPVVAGNVSALPGEIWHIVTSAVFGIGIDSSSRGKAKRGRVIDSTNPMVRAAAAGFLAALHRYRPQLAQVPELQRWYAKRAAGGDRGRESSSQRKQDRDQLIRDTWAAMEANGQRPTNPAVAAQFGCSISTVIRAFKSTPDKQPAR
jgi:hypothetical protein